MTPRRTQEHVVGDRAVGAVSKLIVDAGHSVEVIASDYGEDLLVQTSHAGRMDASRLWFQVKGTEDSARLRLKTGGFSLSVPFGHAMRWARTLDPVVVVLWDVSRDCGWYALPFRQMEEWKRVERVSRTVTLRFKESNSLDLSSIELLAWESRVEHYRLLTLSAQDYEADLDDEPSQWSESRALAGLNFAVLIGLIEESMDRPPLLRVGEDIRDLFVDNIGLLEDIEDEKEAIYIAAIHTVLQCANRKHEGLALPMALMAEGAEILVTVSGARELFEDEGNLG